jgi:ribosome biogenesis GTPase A
MAKSIKMIEENLPLVDAVLYILDARAVKSCFNPSFDKLISDKKTLYLINKTDLSDEKVNKQWKDYFAAKGQNSILINGKDNSFVKELINRLTALLTDKIEKYRAKGITMPLRAMVIGIPNSGKSTIINTLCGSKKAATGDKPGITKSKQWVRIGGGVELLDTPGTLWNAFADQKSARHLAYIGSIGENAIDPEELCVSLLEELKELYPQMIEKKYGIDSKESGLKMLEQISVKKGCLTKAGIDLFKGANAVLDDFKKAKIGRISLEVPDNASI